ncbi:interferon-induced GTP-binding protein mx [Striga asiatica]|uniref:Interferon-induced GTP-binding protein mx n=1 Tax=Striga asiatica TaxID=4170 RepID=A0A5A7PL69_STRAF|nr:interferon-induced GTP-binding protein mx [Striga asiatica]
MVTTSSTSREAIARPRPRGSAQVGNEQTPKVVNNYFLESGCKLVEQEFGLPKAAKTTYTQVLTGLDTEFGYQHTGPRTCVPLHQPLCRPPQPFAAPVLLLVVEDSHILNSWIDKLQAAEIHGVSSRAMTRAVPSSVSFLVGLGSIRTRSLAQKEPIKNMKCISSEHVLTGNNKIRMGLLKISDNHTVAPYNAPIVSSYNDRIRPLLDTIDRLRHLNVVQEGIQLPTIVVVGDQSSGKSSVLESLAGISLPRGQGICTRVPLIMRLRNHPSPNPELSLEFSSRTVPTDEANVADAIRLATEEIAGEGKGISNTPLILVVKKSGVPDLTMIDLPGITRVPVPGQADDIYEQISRIIMEFITPEESIILNVLSAGVDFATCESIRMSRQVDGTGQRTLAVVTKVDKDPEGLLEKVTSDDTYEEAREEEAWLFKTHHLLSRISPSMVGIPVLAQRLVQIQASLVLKCLPDIARKVNDRLSSNMDELTKLPRTMTSVAEAMTAFVQILCNARESLKKILLRGEIDEYPDEKDMHCTARLAEMLSRYSDDMQVKGSQNESMGKLLLDEISVLEETKAIGLPNFLPRAAFLILLEKKVKGVSFMAFDFVNITWAYIEKVLISVLTKHSDNYPQLLSSMRQAARNLVAMKRKQSEVWVVDMIEMEKMTDYTCDPEYMASWSKLMANQNMFKEILKNNSMHGNVLPIDGHWYVDVGHLRGQKGDVHEAFDLKMRLTAYWKIVLRRMVDCMALHLMFSIRNLVNKEMEVEIVNEVMGPEGKAMDRMLQESPAVAEKRKRLNNSVELLKESKDVVAKIIDNISGISM